MKLLRTIRDSDVFPGTVDRTPDGFTEKILVRAILLDEDGMIPLIHVQKHNYYRLPGSDVAPGAKVLESLKIGLRNETGYDCTLTAEVGQTIELRMDTKERVTTFCYIAKTVGEDQGNKFTDGDKEIGCVTKWFEGLDIAIATITDGHADSYDARFMIVRDTTFLREAEFILL